MGVILCCAHVQLYFNTRNISGDSGARHEPHILLEQGIGELTIAEILEMEPELRKEVEKELNEHNWAP